MAVTENEELSHFYKLFSEQKKQVLEMDYLPVYLNFFKSDRYEHYY